MSGEERRGHRRVDAEVAGHIVGHKGHESIALRTYNLSCSGCFCRVPQYVTPFTRLSVAMFLPGDGSGKGNGAQVTFSSVVVRTDPPKESADVKQYHLAVFFDDLSDEERLLIEEYLARHPQD